MSTASQEERPKSTKVAIEFEEQPHNPLLIAVDTVSVSVVSKKILICDF